MVPLAPIAFTSSIEPDYSLSLISGVNATTTPSAYRQPANATAPNLVSRVYIAICPAELVTTIFFAIPLAAVSMSKLALVFLNYLSFVFRPKRWWMRSENGHLYLSTRLYGHRLRVILSGKAFFRLRRMRSTHVYTFRPEGMVSTANKNAHVRKIRMVAMRLWVSADAGMAGLVRRLVVMG